MQSCSSPLVLEYENIELAQCNYKRSIKVPQDEYSCSSAAFYRQEKEWFSQGGDGFTDISAPFTPAEWNDVRWNIIVSLVQSKRFVIIAVLLFIAVIAIVVNVIVVLFLLSVIMCVLVSV